MDTQVIVEYIVSIAPAIASIISVITALLVMIKKVTKIDNESRQENKDLRQKVETIVQENAELKKTLNKVLRKVHHILDE